MDGTTPSARPEDLAAPGCPYHAEDPKGPPLKRRPRTSTRCHPAGGGCKGVLPFELSPADEQHLEVVFVEQRSGIGPLVREKVRANQLGEWHAVTRQALANLVQGQAVLSVAGTQVRELDA